MGNLIIFDERYDSWSKRMLKCVRLAPEVERVLDAASAWSRSLVAGAALSGYERQMLEAIYALEDLKAKDQPDAAPQG
jgi:hypothetical protein